MEGKLGPLTQLFLGQQKQSIGQGWATFILAWVGFELAILGPGQA